MAQGVGGIFSSALLRRDKLANRRTLHQKSYAEPYQPAFPVICFDEVPYQMVSETRLPLPVQNGKPLRYDFEYRREGICNLFLFQSHRPANHTRFRTVGVTRWWVGRDIAALPGPVSGHANCLKTRRVPAVRCTLCLAKLLT